MISNIFNEAKIDDKFKLQFSAVSKDQQKVQWNKIGSSFVGPAKDICQFKLSPLSSPAFLPARRQNLLEKKLKFSFESYTFWAEGKYPDIDQQAMEESWMYFVPVMIM